MRVYGDRVQTVHAKDAFDQLAEDVARAEAPRRKLDQHAARVTVLIRAGMLHQGIADLEFEARGSDDDTVAQQAGLRVLMGLARCVAMSWDGLRPDSRIAELLAAWRKHAPTTSLSLRTPEGFAHYAVYPEAYLEAARARPWSGAACVIGLRSIGVTLGAMVAAGLPAGSGLTTLRPSGQPFTRHVTLTTRLRQRLLAHQGSYAVVDEGPGLSGSSFGGVADMLDEGGVPPGRIVFLPSHAAGPGAMASVGHRARWGDAQRIVADFDQRIGLPRLSAWVKDALGAPTAPARDLSGGAWRAETGRSAPVTPLFERRKFLFETGAGAWLVKFAGLGDEGARKVGRARILADAGFTPSIGGVLHGFLAEAWIPDAKPLVVERSRLVDHLARYLAFRALRLPAPPQAGAELPALADMACVNALEALGGPAGARVRRKLLALVGTAPAGRSVYVDGRLHAWEWLLTPAGEILKTDAVDHACGHDLVGCQDISWDIAGAEVEFDLTPPESDRLLRRMGEAGAPVSLQLLDIHRATYCAFQLGLWSFAPPEERQRADAHARRYQAGLLRFAEIPMSGEDPWTEVRRPAI